MPLYLLSAHIYLCRSGSDLVLLDLKCDKYFALSSEQAALLDGWVEGWPVRRSKDEDGASARAPHHGECDEPPLAAQLLARGVLTTSAAAGKPAAQVEVDLPMADLRDECICERSSIRWHHLVNFIWAAVVATAALRWRPIQQVVRNVKRRRGVPERDIDLPRARELVMIYHFLRPFLFTARNACLFDALALLGFLSRYGVYPKWVFGIQTPPFSAHCWIQHGSVVFNDKADHVRNFVPIMSV